MKLKEMGVEIDVGKIGVGGRIEGMDEGCGGMDDGCGGRIE